MPNLRIKVMLSLPVRIEPHGLSMHSFSDGLFVHQHFFVLPPRSGHLELVEQREFHAFSLLARLDSVMGAHAIMAWDTLQSHRL